ncbi:MAG: hypothetical protein CMI53_02415 [Parcubacteria group bacterium]|nr:hypothetical protein [Parcubacteria group bacterium]|tara:strand:- start:1818 stop:2678 length:861 start_codon:yes stop_codon:yes gene_type:complete
MTENEKPPIDLEEEGHEGAEIIDFSEIQAAAKSEQEQPDLESEKSRLEAKILEVCSTIETRARSISERLQAAYNKIDSPDIEELKKAATENHQSFFGVIDQDRASFLEFASQAASSDDIEQIEQKLETEMLAGSMANLDNAEAQLQEVERLAESQTADSLTDRFFDSGGVRKPTEEELAGMPEFVRNEVMHQMEQLDQDASSFETEAEGKISSLETRYRAVRDRVKGIVGQDTFRQIEEGFGFLRRAMETLKSLPEDQKRGLEAQEVRTNIDRMLGNLDTLSVRWG